MVPRHRKHDSQVRTPLDLVTGSRNFPHLQPPPHAARCLALMVAIDGPAQVSNSYLSANISTPLSKNRHGDVKQHVQDGRDDQHHQQDLQITWFLVHGAPLTQQSGQQRRSRNRRRPGRQRGPRFCFRLRHPCCTCQPLRGSNVQCRTC